jgi:dihydroflavonol-4-reductase
MPPTDTVLVTGGTGFLAAHTLARLLSSGDQVRTTVRSVARQADVHAMMRAAGADTARLSFAVADLLDDVGWAEAMADVSHVLHVASPFPARQPKSADELITPARNGTLRVLRAAQAAGVRRVVLTSSFAAIGYGHRGPGPFDETMWTDVSAPITPYVASKTLAEKAAWEYADDAGLELVAINPSGIFGPALGPDYASSLGIVTALLERQLPFLPDVSFGAVDVRDAADLHIQAMTHPGVAGQRIIASAAYTSMSYIATLLREHLGGRADRVPTRRMPTPLLKALAVAVPSLRPLAQDAGQRREPLRGKAIRLLGWEPRPLAETIVDTAHSLLDLPAG